MIKVYISGCWDMFHVGHLNVIRRASKLGDYLIVGVATDEFVFNFKGHGPLCPFCDRLDIISALCWVDIATPHKGFNDLDYIETYGATIRAIGPEFGVAQEQRDARTEQEARGVRFVMLPRTLGISTSGLKEECYETRE